MFKTLLTALTVSALLSVSAQSVSVSEGWYSHTENKAVMPVGMFGGPREIIKDFAAGGTTKTIESLFTSGEWSSSSTKRARVPAGIERGSSTTASAAITIGTAWGGTLILDVYGTVSGAGGAASAGVGNVGGDAIDANVLGSSSQKIQINVMSGGIVRGGGGSGGKGGNGTLTETPAYSLAQYNVLWYMSTSGEYRFTWAGTLVASGGGSPSTVVGPYTYSTNGGETGDSSAGTKYYPIKRTSASTGGNGGRGQGYDGVNAAGAASGGGTAGAGGTGGTYGNSGSAGASSGSAGGTAGNYIKNRAANVTLVNNGTVQGV